MSREDLNISMFDKGIISTADKKDISNNAASWSLDVDRETKPGTLIGRQEDVEYIIEDDASLPCVHVCEKIDSESGADTDLIIYNKSAGKVQILSELYGGKSLTDKATIGTKSVTMESLNGALRMGWGKSAAEPSKWIGRITYERFGVAPSSDIQYLGAELNISGYTFPNFYKVITDKTTADSYYGIEWQGKKIYKFDSTGIILISKEFVSLQGMCSIPGDTSNFYVFDKTSYGILYKIRKSDLVIVNTYIVEGWGSASVACPADVSDMVMTNGNFPIIYFYIYHGEITFTNGMNKTIIYYIDVNLLAPTFVALSGFTLICSSAAIPHKVKGGVYDSSLTPFIGDIYDEPENFGIYARWPTIWFDQVGEPGDPQYAYVTFNMAVLILTENINQSWEVADGTVSKIKVHSEGNTAREYSCSIGTNGMYLVENMGTTSYSLATSQSTMRALNFAYTASWHPTIVDEDTSYPTFSTASSFLIPSFAKGCICAGITASSKTKVYANEGNGLGKLIQFFYDTNGAKDTLGTGDYLFSSNLGVTPDSLSSDGGFDGQVKPFYRLSLIYDLVQESPLTETIWSPASIPADGDIVRLTVTAKSALVARITGINIYRAENPDGGISPTTLYRFVETIDLTQPNGNLEVDDWGTTYIWDIIDVRTFGPSYEQNSGIAETLSLNWLNYELSTQILGYHFVARAWNSELKEADLMLFRSKQNAFDMFDWTKDYIVLPFYPTALKAFAGSIFAFGENQFARINPQGMYLEEIFNGYGAHGPLAVAVTAYGMFFADKNNCYYHDGSKVSTIGDSIKYSVSSYGLGWTSMTSHADAVSPYAAVLPFLKMNYVVFIPYLASRAGQTSLMYAYHLPTKGWDCWLYNREYYGAPLGVFNDKYGDAYLSGVSKTTKLCSSSTRKSFTWYSADFSFGDSKQKKAFYSVSADYSGAAPTISIAKDGGSGFATFVPKSYFQTLTIMISGAATTIVDYITVQYRKLIGNR